MSRQIDIQIDGQTSDKVILKWYVFSLLVPQKCVNTTLMSLMKNVQNEKTEKVSAGPVKGGGGMSL